MRAAIAVVVLLSVLPALAQAATPIPESVYRVIASNPAWGTGIGWLAGHPREGAHLWLENVDGSITEAGFSIGGSQDRTPTSAGTLVVDSWVGPDFGRFVAAYIEDDADLDSEPATNGTASGGGRIRGWTITVVGHT